MELTFYFQLIFNAKCDRKVLGIYRSGIYDWANVARFSSNAAEPPAFNIKELGWAKQIFLGKIILENLIFLAAPLNSVFNETYRRLVNFPPTHPHPPPPSFMQRLRQKWFGTNQRILNCWVPEDYKVIHCHCLFRACDFSKNSFQLLKNGSSMDSKGDLRNQPYFVEPHPIKSTFIVQLSNLFEKYILVRPSISPQYTSRISVSGVQENWRIGVKIWKGLVLWSGLMGTFFFGGILFLQMVFFGSKFCSAKLRIRLLSTSLNSLRSQARQASARFCIFAHYLALRRGREWIFQSSKSVDWALNSNQCYQCMCLFQMYQMSIRYYSLVLCVCVSSNLDFLESLS